ncbi:hypothetical protein [Halobacterium litoreum]|uniref:Uncharacterized protein n=1 Tax=Halobacterium litoreum TaxID=2039234 RepID=A0ABD5NA45_9EURY|nr:hypothetical protein [Halobacterium litoreum]UHH12052.1 hypothetical protein LT972_07770 [Halobacterium litoreum]
MVKLSINSRANKIGRAGTRSVGSLHRHLSGWYHVGLRVGAFYAAWILLGLAVNTYASTEAFRQIGAMMFWMAWLFVAGTVVFAAGLGALGAVGAYRRRRNAAQYGR